MIGKKIKTLRKKKGLSITQLAQKAGVSKSYLSYLERELRSNPSLDFLSKIAYQLDSSVEYLLQEVQPEGAKLDEEWIRLLNQAISEGMDKEDFQEAQEFIKFKHWQENNKPESK